MHLEKLVHTPPGALVRVALRGQLVLRVLAVLQPRLLLRVQEVRPRRAGRQHKLQPWQNQWVAALGLAKMPNIAVMFHD